MEEDESIALYRRLAEFHYQMRRFLDAGNAAARTSGLWPQQLQLMLTLKGLPEGERPTITALATRLCLKHHSAIELVTRLVERGFAVRRRSRDDRREVLVELTPSGENILKKPEDRHIREMDVESPELCRVLLAIVSQTGRD